MQVTKEGIERIKSANELAAVIAERGIEIKRAGKGLVASCPFHEEKTPSFTITPSKGLFHCFGCGVSGDVIGFVTRYDRVSFPKALEILAGRASLSIEKLMEKSGRPPGRSPGNGVPPPPFPSRRELLARIVQHYHRTFCEREDAQNYLKSRGLADSELWRTFHIGYADGSLRKVLSEDKEIRRELLALGILTAEGRELLGGCIVFPIPDPVSGDWTTLYGRGVKRERHCYLPGPLRGVWNYQAARSASEVVLTESIIDALSFLELGIRNAIPLYGVNGFTENHLDLLLKSPSKRVVLCLDRDEAGQRATESLAKKLDQAGLSVRIAELPEGAKDPNDLLVKSDGKAREIAEELLRKAHPLSEKEPAASPESEITAEGGLLLRIPPRLYCAKAFNLQARDRLRVVLRVEMGNRFSLDTVDLYAARSRREYAKRAGARLSVEPEEIEEELLTVLSQLEACRPKEEDGDKPTVPHMTEGEKAEALAFLKRADLLEQVTRDIDALGYVGEETIKRLLYLVAISRKLPDPLSAVILSQSGAGKSSITEVIERLTPPEDVVLLTRLTPQSLYYVEPGFLDQKLVIIEERYGSIEADYSIRVLQSRKKLIAAAPIKDPQTGNMRTKIFSVEARAAFIEATTATSVNQENATRCFELSMDESVEQTARIHERQRLLRTEAGLKLRQQSEGLLRLHWNAQRLLEPLPVVIPFAKAITFPSTWMRTRRDHARFLNLIEVSAFVHQHQREQIQGAIYADVKDYDVAYALAKTVLTDTLSELKKPLRNVYGCIQRLSRESEQAVSRREVREALQMPDSTVRRWLSELVELEYLEVETKGQGRAARYRLTGRGPKEEMVLGLLAPSELRAKLNLATSPNFATRGGGV